MTQFFDQAMSETYDQKNSRLAPISQAMHFLIRLILQDHLPERARILCVGVGTGAEIIALAPHVPNGSFVGLDPSADMLTVCRQRLEQAGLLARCELIRGHVQDLPDTPEFDAVLSVLVGHFVPQTERLAFYSQMQQRLKPGGYLINTEISFDLDTPQAPGMIANWKRIQSLMGATPASLDTVPHMLRTMLTVLPPDETEQYLQASGIPLPTRFFQAFMVTGWYGQKP